jgi:hypothetical protein
MLHVAAITPNLVVRLHFATKEIFMERTPPLSRQSSATAIRDFSCSETHSDVVVDIDDASIAEAQKRADALRKAEKNIATNAIEQKIAMTAEKQSTVVTIPAEITEVGASSSSEEVSESSSSDAALPAPPIVPAPAVAAPAVPAPVVVAPVAPALGSIPINGVVRTAVLVTSGLACVVRTFVFGIELPEAIRGVATIAEAAGVGVGTLAAGVAFALFSRFTSPAPKAGDEPRLR